MATNTNIETLSTGYDVQVIGEHPPQLNCGICTLIIKHAMHGCTQHAFCKGCISKHIECGIRTDGNVKCPGGCNIIINPSKLEPNHFADRMVNTLRTKCSNADCQWQGDLLDLVQVHQTKCDYATQLCGNDGCIKNYLKKEATQHDAVCLFKTIQCSYCCADMIRMNKDTHEVECLNEQINCKYYDIGCKKQLCRKDINDHEVSHQMQHMTLIYQNLSHQNNEISVLKQHNITSNNEISVLKQQNSTSSNEVAILKRQVIACNNEISTLKQQNITSNNEITILKQQNTASNNENLILKKKLEELKFKTSKEIVQLNQDVDGILQKMKSLNNESCEIIVLKELSNMELKSGVFDISHLKNQLNAARGMNGKVSLVNSDQVMIVKCKSEVFNIRLEKLSECYTNNKFDYLLDLYDLNHNKDLMVELFDNIPYHWYKNKFNSACRHDFTLVFPLDLNNIKNMNILIPDKCRITIVNNEFMVEKLNKQWHRNDIYLHTGRYKIKLEYSNKYNLQRLYGYRSYDNFLFAPGYACLELF